MPKFHIAETIHSEKVTTARLGTAANLAGRYTDADVGKAVKLVAESRFALCADADQIEGFISSVGNVPLDGFSVGGVFSTGVVGVTAEATLTVGQYVTAGTPTAAGTKLAAKQLVKPAVNQATAAGLPFKWRVVSLGAVGTGAAGTEVFIERI